MYYVYFNSGTTNTRAYLIKNQSVIQRAEINVGSRDSALKRDNSLLISFLKQLYDDLLKKACLDDSQIHEIYMSGMISSPSGLVEVEHLSTPITIYKLKQELVSYYENTFFKRNINIVPGIKTIPQGQVSSIENVININNMRGEEIEIMGILHCYPTLSSGSSIIILPGSHTQVAFLHDGQIEDISSNITGELYYAITTSTILGASLTGSDEECENIKIIPDMVCMGYDIDISSNITGELYYAITTSTILGASLTGSDEECENIKIIPDMVCMGYDISHTYGFNRALYLIRNLDIFTNSSLSQRFSYMEGVINGGVMDAITQITKDKKCTIAMAGSKTQYDIFKSLISQKFKQFDLTHIPEKKELPYSVEGFLNLISIS